MIAGDHQTRSKFQPLLIAITLLAAIVRVMILFNSVDIPGDGPHRVVAAYNWAAQPRWIGDGVWPPGYMYITGLFSWVVRDPNFTARLLNFGFGVAAVPLLFSLVRRIYGNGVAIVSAIGLTFFQLHIGLSVSSLTESFLLTFTLAAMWGFVCAVQTPQHQSRYLWFGVVMQILAEMTRYEAWVFIPCFITYYGLATRQGRKTGWIGLSLLGFPIIWLLGNHFGQGNALLGFQEANRGTDYGAIAVSPLGAFRILWNKLCLHVPWPILAAIGVGLGQRLWQMPRNWPRLTEWFYLSVLGLYWLAMYRFTIVRGDSLWERYLMFGVTLALPYAAWGFKPGLEHRRWSRQRWIIAVLSVVFAIGMLLPRPAYTNFYVVRQAPVEVLNISRWLHQSGYSESAILMTAMDWDSTYFPLYVPGIRSRHLIASAWTADREIKAFVATQKPKLMITRAGVDDRFKPQLAKLLQPLLDNPELIHQEGQTQVYRLP
jgi:4-amino-4-deoxy-L-arabinose transferase-like glycosyltransferase